MTLILAIIPVLLLIVLMAFFKMSGDKSSIISLIVTMLIALFGFAFSVDNLFYSFLYGALKAVSPILIIILMAIFSYNVLLKTEKMEIIKQQFASISTDKSIQVLLLTWGFGGLLEAMAGFGTAVAIPAAILISLGFKPIFSATVSRIVRILPDRTPLNIKTGKLKQFLLKDATLFSRKLRHEKLVGIAGISRIAAAVFHITHNLEELGTGDTQRLT